MVLEDIPATPTYRAQQLQFFSQVVTAAPPQYQAVLYPIMLELSDVPNRHEIADQLRPVDGVGGPNPEVQQIQQQAQEVVQESRAANAELQKENEALKQQLADKSDELDLKARTWTLKRKRLMSMLG